jgi:hypothetical protein
MGLEGHPEIKERSEDLGIDGRIILKFMLEKCNEVAQDRDSWQAVVNMVMNLHVLQNAEYFLAS